MVRTACERLWNNNVMNGLQSWFFPDVREDIRPTLAGTFNAPAVAGDMLIMFVASCQPINAVTALTPVVRVQHANNTFLTLAGPSLGSAGNRERCDLFVTTLALGDKAFDIKPPIAASNLKYRTAQVWFVPKSWSIQGAVRAGAISSTAVVTVPATVSVGPIAFVAGDALAVMTFLRTLNDTGPTGTTPTILIPGNGELQVILATGGQVNAVNWIWRCTVKTNVTSGSAQVFFPAGGNAGSRNIAVAAIQKA